MMAASASELLEPPPQATSPRLALAIAATARRECRITCLTSVRDPFYPIGFIYGRDESHTSAEFVTFVRHATPGRCAVCHRHAGHGLRRVGVVREEASAGHHLRAGGPGGADRGAGGGGAGVRPRVLQVASGNRSTTRTSTTPGSAASRP